MADDKLVFRMWARGRWAPLRTDRDHAVRPGYHANKRHWNSVDLDGSIGADELIEMIEHSYQLVVDRLPGAARLWRDARQ
jgi:predicted DNA-binding protein (MmcQ/YjbR family)